MNMWSYPDSDVDGYCLKLHNSGIRNLFIQTGRSNTPAIKDPALLGQLIETCHKYKIRAIAWSFADLQNPESDAQKMLVAAKFRTPNGHGFDAISPNLEKDLNAWKVEKYSKILRDELGQGYPMIAVVFSPLNKAPQVALTPWKLLDKYYDVIAPMDYWNSKFAKLEPYSYTRDTVQKVRELVGRPDVEIHIVGDGMHTHAPAIAEFLKACRDTSVTSASLYPFHKMTDEQFTSVSHYNEYFPVNSRYRLAAFHELLQTGAFPGVKQDPSKLIRRGEFYRLLGNRLTNRHDLAEADAVRILNTYGLIPASFKQALAETPLFLDQSMEHREAYMLVANVLEGKERAHKMKLHLDGHKPVKLLADTKHTDWFAQPAMAQGGSDQKYLNYLDAAQIVLSAESGLR